MSTINGTFLSLHSCNPNLSRYYNTLKFNRRICLADCLDGGRPPYSESYKFLDSDEAVRRIGEVNPLEELFFVESNSAHHISRYLAIHAYDSFTEENGGKRPENFLVLNFDQHEDHGTPAGRFYCGSWGGYVAADLSCDYLVIGVSKGMEAFLYPYDNGKETYSLKEPEVLEEIYSQYDRIYVTVDMDVLTGGKSKRTNWGHGYIDQSILNILLKMIPSEKIISADITGFPPKPIEHAEDVDVEEINSYFQDITEIAKTLTGLMGKPLYI